MIEDLIKAIFLMVVSILPAVVIVGLLGAVEIMEALRKSGE